MTTAAILFSLYYIPIYVYFFYSTVLFIIIIFSFFFCLKYTQFNLSTYIIVFTTCISLYLNRRLFIPNVGTIQFYWPFQKSLTISLKKNGEWRGKLHWPEKKFTFDCQLGELSNILVRIYCNAFQRPRFCSKLNLKKLIRFKFL